MFGKDLKAARLEKGWTQQQAAARLNVSQTYLSLLEAGVRSAPPALARKLVAVLKLSPLALPLDEDAGPREPSDRELAEALAALGYPGFSYLRHGPKRNPAATLLAGLAKRDLDRRVVEGLPWLVFAFYDLDWRWLIPRAKARDLQNRLGFVTSVARQLSEKASRHRAARLLSDQEAVLYESRLARQDTVCHDSMTQTERRWLREHRPPEASKWNVLTDLSAEHLSHAL
jgi:transcriptional regulator with XRE-family HTH domain